MEDDPSIYLMGYLRLNELMHVSIRKFSKKFFINVSENTDHPDNSVHGIKENKHCQRECQKNIFEYTLNRSRKNLMKRKS